MESMLAHCGCVAPPLAATDKKVKYCNFQDLICLKKWKAVWYGWNEFEYVNNNEMDLKYDLTTGHRCPHCLPTCNGVHYRIEVDDMILRPTYGKFYSHGIL